MAASLQITIMSQKSNTKMDNYIVGNNKRCILYTRSNYIDNQFTIPTNVIQKTKTVSFNSDAFFQ